MPGFSLLFELGYAVDAELVISVRTKMPLGMFKDATRDNLGTFQFKQGKCLWQGS